MSVFVTRRGGKNELDEYKLSLLKVDDASTPSLGSSDGAGTTVDDCAIFAGGEGAVGTQYRIAVKYSPSLTKTEASSGLSVARGYLAAATAGEYAIFAGGRKYVEGTSSNYVSNYYNTVDALDSSLTRTLPSENLSVGRYDLGAASFGDCAVFAGGRPSSGTSDAVDAYDSSLTKTVCENLTNKDQSPSGAGTAKRVFFGPYGTATQNIDTFDRSLTKSVFTGMREAKIYVTAATIGEFALFAGGQLSNGTRRTTVDAVNSSLTRRNVSGLSMARRHISAGNTENFAVLLGGYGSSGFVRDVDVYDKSLTRTTCTALSSFSTGMPVARAGANLVTYAWAEVYREIAVKQY